MNAWKASGGGCVAIEPDDWEVHYRWNQDSELSRHLDHVWFPQSRAAVKKWAEETALARSENDDVFLVIETLSGDYAGIISVHNAAQRNGTFKYGLAILPKQQRKGYATEAIRLVLRHYFNELRYQKANAFIYSFNTASIKLHEQFGFQLEGRLRRMIYTHGNWHDELVYGMTAEEFAALSM